MQTGEPPSFGQYKQQNNLQSKYETVPSAPIDNDNNNTDNYYQEPPSYATVGGATNVTADDPNIPDDTIEIVPINNDIATNIDTVSDRDDSSESQLANSNYKYKSTTNYCNIMKVLQIFIILIISISILLGIAFGIGYGGYMVVLSGVQQEEYADTFDLEGRCELISEYETSRRSCSGSGSKRRCTTKYTAHYTWKLIDNNNYTMPCEEGKIFEHSESGHSQHYVTETVKCWSNENCDSIYTSLYNDEHATAGWIYFGASLLFVTALCYFCCCIIGCYNYSIHLGNETGCCCTDNEPMTSGPWKCCCCFDDYLSDLFGEDSIIGGFLCGCKRR